MSFDISLIPAEYRPLVRHYPSVTSTMDVAAQLVRDEDAPGRTLVMADEQTAGRGRQGRTWTTYPGHSFSGTFILRGTPSQHLPLVMALTVFQALTSMAPALPVVIKWPNDILLLPPAAPVGLPPASWPHVSNSGTLLGGAKLAGILIETSPVASLFGLGLNLSRSPAMTEAFQGVTLEDAGLKISREQFLSAFFPCLSANLPLYAQQGWAAFHHNYVRHCVTLGQPVVWKNADNQELRGYALGLHEQSGALEIKDEGGTVHLIHSGDVVAQGRNHPA